MIEIKTIMSLAFLKKEHFSGSSQGMRYRLEKEGEEIRATVFPGPWCYEKTPREVMETEQFPFTEEGLSQAVAWLNEKYEDKKSEWEKGTITAAWGR